MGRLFLLLLVALGLSSGTWVRSPKEKEDNRQILTIDRLRVPQAHLAGGIEIADAWQLRSPNFNFYGYSALLVMDDGTLLGLSDNGRSMRFTRPDAAHPSVKITLFALVESVTIRGYDLEAATRDPTSGHLWAAYERTNYIERYESNFDAARVRPREMRHWPENQGPEAMVRLADGRFIVLSEGSPRWFATDLPALLFPGDPVDGARPEPFLFHGPNDFVPVDMAELPDGRVLILLRAVRWRLPPRFENKLVVADPADISPGHLWSWTEIAHLTEPVPMDNYEGLAVEPGEDGSVVLWLISDDNRSTFQRTLLLKLLWRPDE